MSFENSICPYISKCLEYVNGGCSKLRKFRECGDYEDFEAESSGVNLNDVSRYVVEKMSKVDKSETKIDKIFEECPYKLNCHLIFKKECDKRRLNNECDIICEECEFYLPEYGVYCETIEYNKCESYKVMSVLKDSYAEVGVYNTNDLKEFYGEELYEQLGAYIRCTFIELEIR